MKVLLIIGHNPRSRGAYNAEIRMSEFDFWNDYVNEQIDSWKCTPHDFKLITRPPYGGYHSEMRKVHDHGSRWGADCSIEFHFNAAIKKAEGHEVLYYRGSAKGKALAKKMDSQFDKHLSNRDRGVKPRGVNDSGGYGLYVGKYPSILVEPFFNGQLGYYMDDGKYRDALDKSFFGFFESL